MAKKLLFFLSLCASFAFSADVINVHGVVQNSAKKPIANAILTLSVKGLKDTTTSDGKYHITGPTSIATPAVVPHTQKITFTNGILELALTAPSPVKVELFDVKGHLVKKEIIRNAQAGMYRLNIRETGFASNLLVIHASIGQSVSTFRYFPLSNGNAMMSATGSSSGRSGGSLSKAVVISDTVKVTATGYSPKAVPITSYDTLLDITLDSAGNESVIAVNLDQERQVIRGFGVNNTWGYLSSTDGVIAKCFDSTTGLGLNVLRIGMQPSGEPYEAPNSKIVYDDIKAASKLGCKYFIGTCWTAPKEWKSNNSENDGGSLNKDKWEAWSDRIAAFPGKVESGTGGIKLHAMSPQNETDFASCGMNEPCNGNYQTMLWTGKDYADFFAIAGPKIKAAGCKTMGPEASEWLHAWSDFSACCTEPGGVGSSDPLKCGYLGKDTKPKCDSLKGYNYGRWLYRNKTAWDAVDIFSTHQYDTQVAEPWPSDVPRTNANGTIEVWQTEMSGVKWWPEQGTGTGANVKCNTTIQNGVAVARWIQNALTVGEASAWCYWWWTYLSGGTNDNEGITCQGTLTKRYYTMGNFSRYMRPGQKVVNITGTKLLPAKVLLVASKSSTGKVVIVAVNETTTAQSIPITITGGTVPASFKPIVTADGTKNWAEGTAVTTVNGVLTAQLEATSVTTFVSQ